MMRVVRRVVIYAVGIVLLTIALIETVFRVWPPAGLTREVLLRGANPEQLIIEPHPYMSYVPTRNLSRVGLHHNSLGFRGPEIAVRKEKGTLRILCLGDSATYGFGNSSDEFTYPERLSEYLQPLAAPHRVEVVNAAAPGYTSFEALTMLQFRGLELEPDIVIVYLGFNDLRASTWPEVRSDNTHFRKTWGLRRSEMEPALELSETYLLARWFFAGYREHATALASYVIVPEDGDQLTHGRHPVSAAGVENYRRNLRSIVAIAREHGLRVLLMTQAYGEATISSEYADIVGDGMTRLAAAVRQIARDKEKDPGVALLDVRRILPAEPGMFADGVHVNDAGADRLARIVAARLASLRWTEPALQNGSPDPLK